jgi:Sir2 family
MEFEYSCKLFLMSYSEGAQFESYRLLVFCFCYQPDRRPLSDMAAFREEFVKAKRIVVLTGAGVSAESGVPTFRGAGGYWRKWQATVLVLTVTCTYSVR